MAAIACSIQRDVAVRGRDVGSVIEQYTQQVKPAFDQYVAPSRKHADVIIPWARYFQLLLYPTATDADVHCQHDALCGPASATERAPYGIC